MNTHLSIRIQDQMPHFSKGQRLIAKYIEEHYDKVAFMTASKLGSTVGVSESTVVRFATELGYDGYPELQRAMQEMIRSKLTSVQRIEVTKERIGKNDILDVMLAQDMDVIRRTMEATSHKDFYEAVDAIIGAKKIYILGARSSVALATFLSYYLGMLFDNVQCIQATSEAEIFEQMIYMTKDDVMIGLSFPRYSKKASKAMHFAHDQGAKVIAITDSLLSPIAEFADYRLLARSDISAIVDSLVAPLSLINSLLVALALKMETRVTKVFQNLENIWDEYGVYEKVDEAENDKDNKKE